MTVKLLTKQHLEFLSLKGGCTGSSGFTLVKLPHCWKSNVMAHLFFIYIATMSTHVKASFSQIDNIKVILFFLYQLYLVSLTLNVIMNNCKTYLSGSVKEELAGDMFYMFISLSDIDAILR